MSPRCASAYDKLHLEKKIFLPLFLLLQPFSLPPISHVCMRAWRTHTMLGLGTQPGCTVQKVSRAS